jgi:subtilisin family serine protease
MRTVLQRLAATVVPLVLVAAVLGGTSIAGPTSRHAVAADPVIARVERQLLVRFRPGTSPAAETAAHGALRAQLIHSYVSVPNLQLVRVASSQAASAILAQYRARPDVMYAERDRVVPLASTTGKTVAAPDETQPNDPIYPNQWDWHNTGQLGGKVGADLDAPLAWDITHGSSSVVVGDTDTGITYTHEDLVANVGFNTAECSGQPGVDDDQNGYVDDCYGIDTINGDTNPTDDNGHGTHTAGTIGAVGNNGIGLTGMNWNVTILACKSHDATGNGSISSIIECMDYNAMEKDAGYDIVATNNSYGGCPEACGFDQATLDAIQGQLDHGILFVAAAGNSNADNDSTEVFPADYALPNVISVAATSNLDVRSTFSNYGIRSVAVGAPGQQIESTWLGNAYVYLDGTSMASPHVAGLAALIRAANPTMDWAGIRNLILAGGEPLSDLSTRTFTGRRINAFGSLTCSNVTVAAPIRPLANVVGGQPILTAYENIKCAQPLGGLRVTVNPGNQHLQLSDGGKFGDQVAHDGIASSNWSPCATGTYTLTFSTGGSETVTVTGATPCITLSTKSGPPGTVVGVRGTGYQPNEKVVITFDRRTLGRGIADATGAFVARVRIPATAPTGPHAMDGVSVSSLRAEAIFTVT